VGETIKRQFNTITGRESRGEGARGKGEGEEDRRRKGVNE